MRGRRVDPGQHAQGAAPPEGGDLGSARGAMGLGTGLRIGRGLLAVGACVLAVVASAPLAAANEAGLLARGAQSAGTSAREGGAVAVAGTAARLAAQEGLSYQDQGTFVLLYDAEIRLRLYPGTSSAVVDGDEFELKDRLRRDAGNVALSERVSRFLTARIRASRSNLNQERRAREQAELDRQRVAQDEALRESARADAREELRRKRRDRAASAGTAALPARDRGSAAGQLAWVPQTTERAWRWIVLHHSDDTAGCLCKYNEIHLNERKWEHGCGYHFVIGNGTQSGDGEVELSKRWVQQLHGAHAKTPDNLYNDYGVGIVLVGDFEAGTSTPTPRQMDSLVTLCRWLMDRYGVGIDAIVGHCHVGKTCCPGRHFPWGELRQRLTR